MDSIRNDDRIFVRLDRGDRVIESLEKLRGKYEINNGFFQGIGAVDRVTLGNYDVEKREYKEKDFSGSFEVPVFQGNIGPDKIHAHITVADREFNPKAGHCSAARVSGTFEILILTVEKPDLKHHYDDSTGLDVFSLAERAD